MSHPADQNTAHSAGPTYDVAVVGGGAAGLSAAVALARFARSVVVVDAGTPRNAPADHVHNLLTRDGTPPGELLRLGRAEVTRFGGHVVAGTVRSIRGGIGAFGLELDDEVITAHRVVVASGSRDELPDVPGLAEHWGRDVVHCGFCHGYEVRGRRIGVLATSPLSIHQAMMFWLLSPSVTLLAHTAPPSLDQVDALRQRGIEVTPGVVTEVVSQGGRLTGVRLEGGDVLELDALVVSSTVHARAEFLAPLGLYPTDFSVNGHVVATRIETGPHGDTDVPGVWIAGSTSEPMAQVAAAAANGLAVAGTVIGHILSQPAPHPVDGSDR